MKNNSCLFLFLITTVVILSFATVGCNRNKSYIVPTTWSVFPTDSGKYRIYHVFETVYSTQGQTDKEYYRKEEIGGVNPELDNLSRNVHALYTYISPAENGTNYKFTIDRIWALYKDTTRYAELIQENKRYLILKYPMYADSTYTWNPQLYTNKDEDYKVNYYYKTLDTTITVNNKTFEHCVLVVENDSWETNNSIRYRKAYTVYAPNVGKVLKYYKQEVRNLNGGQINDQESGVLIEEIVEHN